MSKTDMAIIAACLVATTLFGCSFMFRRGGGGDAEGFTTGGGRPPLALRADRPVLAVNEDNDHYFKKMDVSKMDKAHLVSYLDEILSPGAVTDFFMCPCGQRASFDSKAWEPIWAGLCEPNAKGETNDVWCVVYSGLCGLCTSSPTGRPASP